VSAIGAALGLALLVLLAVTVFALGTMVQRALQSGDDVDPYEGVPGTTATTGITSTSTPSGQTGSSTSESVRVVRPQAASASSVLKATASNSYRATNLLDGDVTTAWNEGAEGPGAGEWVLFEFLEPVVLSRIDLANGYQKDADRFLGNARVRSLKVEYSSGSTQLVDLLDTEEFQSIKTTRSVVEWVKLTVVSVYPDYEWDDAALSEVRFFAVTD